MNYQESKQILEEIKKAKKILINCHRNPDPDSIGSALALYQVVNKLGKIAKVVSPSPISENFKFLPFAEKIEKVNYKNFDFSKYDPTKRIIPKIADSLGFFLIQAFY